MQTPPPTPILQTSLLLKNSFALLQSPHTARKNRYKNVRVHLQTASAHITLVNNSFALCHISDAFYRKMEVEVGT